jgi:ATP-dependent DNA ligase
MGRLALPRTHRQRHLRDTPARARRAPAQSSPLVDEPSLQHEAGAALYAFTLNQGWEGIVAKRLDSPYRPAARNGAWLKAKHPHARDLRLDRSEWRQRERVLREPLIAYN